MLVKCGFTVVVARSVLLYLLSVSVLAFAQAEPSQTGNSDFRVGPPKDSVGGTAPAITGKVSGHAPISRSDSPDRTVGPQQDGSIVVSDNQMLTPAGRLIELGSPVRAKAVALNPNHTTHSGAVLLMGSPQPIIVFNTANGQILQRFIPTDTTAASSKGINAGSFTGIAYSPDGTKLLFSQDNNYVVITNDRHPADQS